MTTKSEQLAARIVSAFVEHNSVSRSELTALFDQVHGAIGRIEAGDIAEMPKSLSPAAPPNKSVLEDHIICLEDGLKFRMLKGHLRASHQLTPAQYRKKWDLPANYPIVAPSYSRIRSEMAKGLVPRPHK
jgi:predicted transcriptional regulator